jgi:hypothetical protein
MAWKYTSLAHWAVDVSGTAMGLEKPHPLEMGGEYSPQLWERARKYWEPFELDMPEAAHVRELGIASYVPRDNLTSIEGRVSGRRPTRSEVEDGLQRLDAVLLRYPRRFLMATGFERLVWLCQIVRDGAPARAVALAPGKAVVLDPTGFDPGVFDHEMYHLVDYRLHGYPGDSAAWNALNPANDRAAYIGVAAYAEQLRKGAAMDHDNPFFVSAYASATPAEDRAEVFRVLMRDPKSAKQRRAGSAVIDAKSRYVIDSLDQLASGSSVGLGLR